MDRAFRIKHDKHSRRGLQCAIVLFTRTFRFVRIEAMEAMFRLLQGVAFAMENGGIVPADWIVRKSTDQITAVGSPAVGPIRDDRFVIFPCLRSKLLPSFVPSFEGTFVSPNNWNGIRSMIRRIERRYFGNKSSIKNTSNLNLTFGYLGLKKYLGTFVSRSKVILHVRACVGTCVVAIFYTNKYAPSLLHLSAQI